MDINNIKNQYTCLICQNIFNNPVKLTKCGHNFCNNCLNNYVNSQVPDSNTQEYQCPMCRTPFPVNEILLDNNLNIEINNQLVKCDCGQTMYLSQYSNHSETCPTVINKMKDEMKNTNIKIQEDKVQKNRQTFDCTLCSQKNFDRVGYIDHIKIRHPNDRGVCAICKCQPWGDPNYKTHILGHINIRHKFDYDTVVDYNDEEDEILKRVLLESMNDK